jgi:SAM-dependent methyltransferase
MIKFNNDMIASYIRKAPLALAFERVFECHILSQQKFEKPILDIGCGDGIFASVLFAEKIDVGIDPDGRELEGARRSDMYDELICCDAQQIPKKDGTFKTVLANSVIEHIIPIREVLKEAKRVTACDGRMYLTVPTHRYDQQTVIFQLLSSLKLNGMAEDFRKFYDRFWKHHHYYDLDGWRMLFEECGWGVVKHQAFNPASARLWQDSLIPLSIVSFFSRKFLNRWFVVPSLRRMYAPVLSGILGPFISRYFSVKDNGGLFFFELEKK